jgi:hypothetical protein
MDSQNRVFLISLVLAMLVALGVLLKPTVEERLAPKLVRSWVGIEVAESGLAEVGPVEVPVGTRFHLYAVLEAKSRSGKPLFYTQAKRLSFSGEEVAADRLRLWDQRSPAKVRWFTVEGERPFVKLSNEQGVESFSMREFLRSAWPLGWSTPGEIDAAHDDHLENDSAVPTQLFGTQRFHVRVELYRFEDDLIPKQTIRSWGVDDLKANIERFPTVHMVAPDRLRPASLVFGLSQLEPAVNARPELLSQIDELARNGVAFSRPSVIRDQIQRTGKGLADLAWRSVDLAGEIQWQENEGDGGAAPGDLLRVGDRLVVLYQDRGESGQLDYQDLCFDFTQGATVRALSDVFSGEGLAVEWAAITEAITEAL